MHTRGCIWLQYRSEGLQYEGRHAAVHRHRRHRAEDLEQGPAVTCVTARLCGWGMILVPAGYPAGAIYGYTAFVTGMLQAGKVHAA